MSASKYSQYYHRLGVGIQTSFPLGGISGKLDLTKQHSAQAIVGIFGPLSTYSGRYLYNFSEDGKNFRIKPYLYGQVGLWSYDFQSFDQNFQLIEDTENSFGFGAGAGIEWHYKPLSDKLRFNIELGFGKVDLIYYEWKTTTFGGGIHYYFEL